MYAKLLSTFLLWFFLPTKISISAVLSGTKYGLKQTRGKFGLGAKMVGSWNSWHLFYICLGNKAIFSIVRWYYEVIDSFVSNLLYAVSFVEVTMSHKDETLSLFLCAGTHLVQNEYWAANWDPFINEGPEFFVILQIRYRY